MTIEGYELKMVCLHIDSMPDAIEGVKMVESEKPYLQEGYCSNVLPTYQKRNRTRYN